MTKKEMAHQIAEDLGLPVGQVQEIVQRTLDRITDTLVTEGRIELRNFGVFQVKDRKPRKARNPRTGEQVMVPSKRSVFKAGREMSERIRETARVVAVAAVEQRTLCEFVAPKPRGIERDLAGRT